MTALLNRLFPHRKPGLVKTLARCWLIQGATWYALSDVLLRVGLEGAFVAVIWSTGVGLAATLVAWLLFHTGTWLVLYGGFFMTWKFLGLSTDVGRLRAHAARLERRFRILPVFRLVALRGSAARGELQERSDIDFFFVPGPSLGSKFLGILTVWGLRAESVLRRIPLEARWVDSERYVPYQLPDESPRVIYREERGPALVSQMASRGLIVSFSGIDGSGKTTIAKRLVSVLKDAGIDAEYFWGHWQAWYKSRAGPDIGLGDLYRSLWNRLGRRVEEFESHPRAKLLYDALTSFDFLYIRWKLTLLARPRRIVVTDRYVADVIAYLRSNGPLRETVEGLLVGLSVPPDLAFLFEVAPETALQRKRERPLRQLNRFAAAYTDLRRTLGLVPIDASQSPETVFSDVLGVVRTRLDPPLGASVREELGGGGIAAEATGGQS